MAWSGRVEDKRSRLRSAIPSEWHLAAAPTEDSVMAYPETCGILTADELAITATSAVDLVEQMATGKQTAVAVTTAFCKRAAIAHQLVNCALEFFPEMALDRARELDAYYAEHSKPIGPLHGLPISLKDQFRIKGLETTMGYVDWIGKFETEDSTLVSLLLKAGAVFYVKTSVPQSLMFGETVNNIIGRTVNPRNKQWSCGGSSGGEGALVSLRGGVIGVGTDIGGSVRIPAAFNFLYGLRPSHGRVPYAGAANSMAGQETVHSVIGPISHSMADMRLFMTSLLAQEPWHYDSKVLPIPWRQSEEDAAKAKIESKGLTLGFFSSDEYVSPHPPVIRGVEEVVSAVKAAGHTVVPWKPYKHEQASDLILKIFSADGGTDVYGTLNKSGEPAIPNFSNAILPGSPQMNVNEVWDMNQEKWKYQCEYLSAIRELESSLGRELDAIIAPIAPSATVLHDEFKYYAYTTVINLLDYTSVVVPVTFADKSIDVKNDAYTPLNPTDARVQSEYDPEAYHGAPVAVQIIGRCLSEEKTMAIAAEVGRLLGNVVV